MFNHTIRPLIRIAVQQSNFHVDHCALNATNFTTLDVACPNGGGGVSAAAVRFLGNILHDKFQFTLVPYPALDNETGLLALLRGFANGEIDMALELWTVTFERSLVVDFSMPVLYCTRAFVVAASNFVQDTGDLRFSPFDPVTLSLFFVMMALLVLLYAFDIYHENHDKEFLKALLTSVDQFIDLSGQRNAALVKRRYGLWATSSFHFGVNIVFRFSVGSFIISSLVLTLRAPFSRTKQLAHKIAQGQLAIVTQTNNSFLDYMAIDDDLKPLIHRTIQYPKAQEWMSLVAENPTFIYPTCDLVARYAIQEACEQYRMVAVHDMASGEMALIFRKNFEYRHEFDSAINALQLALQRKAEDFGRHYKCDWDSQNTKTVKLQLKHFKNLAYFYCTAVALSVLSFFAQLWCKP